ncbi:hypothetical protein D3C76_1655720 [compost metagenome]
MGKVPSKCSSGPFMYSSTRMKPLSVAVPVLGHSAWKPRATPITMKNRVDPNPLAMTN